MCQTSVFIIEDGREVPVLQDVVSLIPEDGQIRIVNLFGEEKVVSGHIRQIDLLAHKIVIQSAGTRA